MDSYRVSAEIIDDDGRRTKLSFIVRADWIGGWKWAVVQAHDRLAGVTVMGDVSVDQIRPEPAEG